MHLKTDFYEKHPQKTHFSLKWVFKVSLFSSKLKSVFVYVNVEAFFGEEAATRICLWSALIIHWSAELSAPLNYKGSVRGSCGFHAVARGCIRSRYLASDQTHGFSWRGGGGGGGWTVFLLLLFILTPFFWSHQLRWNFCFCQTCSHNFCTSERAPDTSKSSLNNPPPSILSLSHPERLLSNRAPV